MGGIFQKKKKKKKKAFTLLTFAGRSFSFFLFFPLTLRRRGEKHVHRWQLSLALPPCGIVGLMVSKQTFLFVSHMAQVPPLLFLQCRREAIETNGTGTRKREGKKRRRGREKKKRYRFKKGKKKHTKNNQPGRIPSHSACRFALS